MSQGAFDIREASVEDLAALAALHVETFKETHGRHRAPTFAFRESQWRSYWERDTDWFCYVAETPDGQLVGFAKGELHKGGVPGFEGELDKIYVLRAWHRRGIGRALVQTVAKRFIAGGVGSMLLFGDARSPSNAFYEWLGAERLISPDGKFEGSYGWRDLMQLFPQRGAPRPQESERSLPEFLAERARLSSDRRLAVDAIGGLLIAGAFSIWRVPAWYLLVAIGACFLFYGMWALAGRELAEAPADAPRRRLILRALALVSAAGGFGAAAFLMLAVVAKLIGRVIS